MNHSTSLDKKKLALRFSGFFVGLAVLLWLPGEESSEIGVVFIAGLICVWLGFFLLLKKSPEGLLKHVIVGAGLGLFIAPLALLLMAIKTGLHGHGLPDFTNQQLLNVLSRTLIYSLAGLLLGAGIGLLRSTKKEFLHGN
jgi:Mn2+/Fe2+ NRAMP family transporter